MQNAMRADKNSVGGGGGATDNQPFLVHQQQNSLTQTNNDRGDKIPYRNACYALSSGSIEVDKAFNNGFLGENADLLVFLVIFLAFIHSCSGPFMNGRANECVSGLAWSGKVKGKFATNSSSRSVDSFFDERLLVLLGCLL